MTRLVVFYDHPRYEEKRIISEARDRGVEVELVNTGRLILWLGDGAAVPDADVYLQRSLSLYRSLTVTAFVEALGGRIVNSSKTQMLCGNKFLTTLMLYMHGVPVPRSVIVFDKHEALKAASELGYPVVVKPVIGSWGRLVARADTPESLEGIIEDRLMLGGGLYRVVYMQEYVNKPDRDLRVFVVGDHVATAIYRVNKSSWRTNTALGAVAEPARVDPELEDVCLRAARAVGGGVLGVDVFEDPERGYLVNEVNANVDFRNTERVTGYNLAGDIVEYLLELARR
ncbi:MAG: lysine biosynthesis protein LysX [Crenarchaeota archaeon]|nr:lysine biosynthesis protein LysX [Thermoproteota archaeon]